MSARIAAAAARGSRVATLASHGPAIRGPRVAILAVLVALLAGGCLPTPETSAAQGTLQLYQLFIAIAVVVGGIVWGLATWMLLGHGIRRLRRREPEGMPPQFHSSNVVEVTWTAIPLVTVLVLFGLTVLTVNRILAVSPSPGARVEVTAFRWGWQIAYPDAGVRYVGAGLPGPDIAVPVGTPVQFTLRSDDVIHAFFVPQFLFKRDAVPGRTSVFDFTVQSPGTYRGQCAEFCGIGHSQMAFSIVAMPPDQFRAWLVQEKTGGPGASPSPPIVGPSSGASAGPSAADAPPASPAPAPTSPAPSPTSPAPSSGDLAP